MNNYNYDSDGDCVSPAEKLSVRVPWERFKAPELRWLSLDGEQQRPCKLEEGELVFEVLRLELYGLAIPRQGSNGGETCTNALTLELSALTWNGKRVFPWHGTMDLKGSIYQ